MQSKPSKRMASDKGHPKHLEIDLGRPRRWIGLTAFIIGLVVVAGVLVWFFLFFTASVKVAVALVAFMIGYMLLMGRWASKNFEQREER